MTQDFTYAEQIRAFWIIGFCGGFTTFFQPLGWISINYLGRNNFFLALFILVSIFGTIIGVLLGIRCCNFIELNALL